DRNVAPARVVGSSPAPQSHSIASAFAEAAADKQEEVEAPKEPERPTYSNDEIFANRPVFGSRPQPQHAPQPVEPVQPVQPAQPAPQPVQQQGEVKSSRMDVSNRQVPAFLRRLRRNDD
ncbi:MAG: hypothetical protein II867_03020, partial [Clostridia bacterium]|nr:hypothetical protein [Clostridia bacterium]